MSRIGRKPLEIPKGVTVSITNDVVSTKGPKGTLTLKRHKDIDIKQTKDDEKRDVIVFERNGDLGPQRAAHGLMRALVGNMLTGVTEGFTRTRIDRQALGAATAKIRSFRPPEPYKGKGIKYAKEVILRKAGKTAGK